MNKAPCRPLSRRVAYHVVALCPEACHVAVDVNRSLRLDSFQHSVDDDEGSCTTDAGTVPQAKH